MVLEALEESAIYSGAPGCFSRERGFRIFAITRSRSSALTVNTYWRSGSGSTENQIEVRTRDAARRLALSVPVTMTLSVVID